MTLTGRPKQLFSYQSEFRGIPETQLPVHNYFELAWCSETLEAYNINACSDYPATDLTIMRSIDLQTGNTTPTVHWLTQDLVKDCGQHCLVGTDSGTGGAVELYYRCPKVTIPWERYAPYVQTLFGVVQDGGGVGIVNGHIIIIPPRNPEYQLFSQISGGMAEVVRGFEVRQAVGESAIAESKRGVGKAGLELMAKGLEIAANAVKKAIGEADRSSSPAAATGQQRRSSRAT